MCGYEIPPIIATEAVYRILWRVVIVTPSGDQQQTIELRAPSEAIAVDRVRKHRPKWVVREVIRRPTP